MKYLWSFNISKFAIKDKIPIDFLYELLETTRVNLVVIFHAFSLFYKFSFLFSLI